MMRGLTKIEVAISQLRLSIALFMKEREHISVITVNWPERPRPCRRSA